MARDAHGCIATDCGVALVQALGIHCDENEHASMLPGVWLNAGFVWSCIHLHLSFCHFDRRCQVQVDSLRALVESFFGSLV